MSEKFELDERAQLLFRHLIQSYTRDGQPVGSKSLARQSGLDVSSATIRNIMAHLESLGLVNSPHTSAGRVPTEAGYRFFIDSLLEVRDLDKTAEQTLSETFSEDKTSQDLIHSASGILSQLTHLTGLVSVSRPARTEVRHLEFMKLSDHRILVIMVVNSDQVHNKVIQVDREYSDLELTEAEKMLARYLVGCDFIQARQKIRQELVSDKQEVNKIMDSVLEVMSAVCGEEQEDLLTAGEANLLQFSELADVGKLRELFDAFNRKRDLLHLLDGCIDADGVQIFIGSESGYEVLNDCTVIGAPYNLGADAVGVLGVIGPKRMAYDKVIPAVDLTARLLSSALKV